MHKITSINTNEWSYYTTLEVGEMKDELDGSSLVRYCREQLRKTAGNFSRGSSSMDQYLKMKPLQYEGARTIRPQHSVHTLLKGILM
jgi:hypothetical protein